jgi:hypothetical protein
MATAHRIRKLVDVKLTKKEGFQLCREQNILPQHFQCMSRFAARAEILSIDFASHRSFFTTTPFPTGATTMTYYGSKNVKISREALARILAPKAHSPRRPG